MPGPEAQPPPANSKVLFGRTHVHSAK
jgi:hypothetical protein